MSIGISLIILLAAVLHASWNALLRAGTDRLWSITMMCIAIALVCGGLALVVAMPARASWGCVILSALFHVGYNLFLVRTYRVGDLGQTYPIARGSSPLLVSLGAALFAGELPDPITMAGVLLVSGGRVVGSDSAAFLTPWASDASSALTASRTGSACGSPARRSAIRFGCACCGAS